MDKGMNSKNFEEHIYYILDNFTKGGTPLTAFLGGRMEWQVTTLVAGLLANQNISQALDSEEIVEAAITYANIIQNKLAQYEGSTVDNLERLMDK
jgi:hypothetical protein